MNSLIQIFLYYRLLCHQSYLLQHRVMLLSDQVDRLGGIFMENNEKLKQLLIIGNGIDLACGFKSSYKDFLGNYLKSIFSTKSNIYWECYFQNISFFNCDNYS